MSRIVFEVVDSEDAFGHWLLHWHRLPVGIADRVRGNMLLREVRSLPADTVRCNRGPDPQMRLRTLPTDVRLPSAGNFDAQRVGFGCTEELEFRLPRHRCAVEAPPAGGCIGCQESLPPQPDRARPAISIALIPYHPTCASSIIARVGHAASASSAERVSVCDETISQASRTASAI